MWAAIIGQESSLHLGGLAELPVAKDLDEIVAGLGWMFGRHQSLRSRLCFPLGGGVRQVIADQEWRTVQLEDSQNQELMAISKQILELTKEMRSDAGMLQKQTEQNKELLDLSRQTLALTKELLSRPAAG